MTVELTLCEASIVKDMLKKEFDGNQLSGKNRKPRVRQNTRG